MWQGPLAMKSMFTQDAGPRLIQINWGKDFRHSVGRWSFSDRKNRGRT